MSMIQRVFAMVVVALGLMAGCAPDPVPPPPMAAVSGTVTLDEDVMPGGEIRFMIAGHPPKTFEIRNGTFSGKAFVGKNQVEIVLEQDGEASTTDPNVFLKVNIVEQPNPSLTADVTQGGGNTFTFAAQTKKKDEKKKMK